MKKFILALFVCLAAVAFVAPVYATELWDPHLHGVDEGLAAGALPPAGLYFINNTWMLPEGRHFGEEGKKDFSLGGAFVEVPILLWVPGCKFLGADYAMAIAQPFDYASLRSAESPILLPNGHRLDVNVGGQQWGTFNTLIVPYILSWRLPCDFRVKTGLSIGIDDATSSPGSPPDNGGPYAESGNGTWTFQPSVGISWLHAGWNASAEFFYAFQTENSNTLLKPLSIPADYQSGDQFAADYTLTYTCGKWTFGGGAAQEQQLFNDKINGVTAPGHMARLWSAGPLVGYNFGPCSLMLTYNFHISATNDVGGDMINARLVIPLWK